MKIAISSSGNTIESRIDPRFGRAACFIIYDDATDEVVQVIDNSESADVPHGAGINAATTIANTGVGALITGQVGPKAQAVLDQAGIKVFPFADGTVRAGIQAFQKGGIAPEPMPPFGSAGPGAGSYGMAGRGAGGGRGRGRGMCGRGGGISGGQGRGFRPGVSMRPRWGIFCRGFSALNVYGSARRGQGVCF